MEPSLRRLSLRRLHHQRRLQSDRHVATLREGKLLMMAQAPLSMVTLAVFVARAIGILR
jgi:hypothetical protein